MIISKVLLVFIPIIGIFILIKGIMMLMRFFNQKIILEIPYTCKTERFKVDKSGGYSIWQKGKLFQKTPVDKFRPVITNESTGEQLSLTGSIFRTKINNGSTARMQLFTFYAPIGNFRLELSEGSSISQLEKSISSLIPGKEMEPGSYFIQIRENQPKYLVIVGIPLTILGFGFFIGGIILFATFDQWIKSI
jgi:hypothetical protein